MARRKEKHEKETNQERWLLTYSDLITLLMIFFVVMYSMSNVDAQKFKAIAGSLSSVLSGTSESVLDSLGPSIIEGEAQQMEEVRQQLQEYIDANNLGNSIKIYIQERGLVISLSDTVLFPSGQASLTPEAQEIMRKVGLSLKGLDNYIRVEGHTDNLPINTQEYPSNWELSAMRSTNVVRFLLKESGLPPEKMSESGYGEYRPIATNDNDAGRTRNRRVDIVILKNEHVGVSEPR